MKRAAATPTPLPLGIVAPARRLLRLLLLGAHADDLEIGCGGTVRLLLDTVRVDCRWIVFSGAGARRAEAQRSARRLLRAAHRTEVVVHDFRDGFFPDQYGAIKETFESLKSDYHPDIVFTHYREDRHQDHRVLSDLAWNTFRSHLIVEYEVPKYDGDLGRPNCFVPLTRAQCDAKIRHLMASFGSQRRKRWFTPETFRGMLRLRGVESGAASGFAEAFYLHKFLLANGNGTI